ncbi:MAG TPA: tRNA lysidine(34) synthetase TilS [Dehalococcoidia bacterium]|nr:tRNA lysidine(34) synthetase TilS [Dehalococcoidia bacterium]
MAAVSGGPDSTALLLALEQLSHRGGFGLAVAHFDHGLRGRDAAEREERFVRELALSLGLPFFSGASEVRLKAKERKTSVEMAARDERYAFLAAAAVEAECGAVATGHTASDQAETVLLNMIRGAGLRGLGGIRPSSWRSTPDGARFRLVRPLLTVTHADTIAYCAARGIEPLEDESNASTAYKRNRVRHELLPQLRTYNPRLDEALVRLSEDARLENEYLDHEAAKGIEGDSAGGVSYSWEPDHPYPKALRQRGLQVALRTLLGDTQEFSQRHVQALERLVFDGRTGDRLILPRGVIAERRRDSILLSIGESRTRSLPEGRAELCVPGEVRFGWLLARATGELDEAALFEARVDAEAAGHTLSVRRRRNGDRFQPQGMSEPKKLQDFFVDEHVPRGERDSIPIFESERGIIWVGGLRIADWARPRPGHPVIHLSYVSA